MQLWLPPSYANPTQIQNAAQNHGFPAETMTQLEKKLLEQLHYPLENRLTGNNIT